MGRAAKAKKDRQHQRTAQVRAEEAAARLETLSHRRKLSRAATHIAEVQRLEDVWKECGARTYMKTNAVGFNVLYAVLEQPVPDEVPLIVGDALACLRQSLDHLVFALSSANTPDMTEKQAGTPMFPLKAGSWRLGLMSMEARAALCSLLPVESAEKTHPLWQLDKVQNRDKHRTLQVAAAAAAVNNFSVNHGRIGSLTVSGGELSAMPLALVEWSPDTAFHGGVNHVMGFAFGAGSSEVAGQSVVGTLDSWHDHIRQNVFPELEPFLTPARRG